MNKKIVFSITDEQFAQWSIERDILAGCDPDPRTLSQDDLMLYIDEARAYFDLPLSQWPVDILDRMKGKISQDEAL